jgi:lipopolysaccharide export system protein LptC
MARLDAHTRRVRILKLVLPLLALAILSSLFMFSKTIDPEAAIPYATVDVEDRLREPKMTDAKYAGTTSDGAALTISAANVIPGANQSASAKQVSGQIVTAAGDTTQIDAAFVQLDGTNAAMTGGVVMQSAGYEMNTDAMDVAIDRVQVSSRGAVTAQGPLGTLDAGQMILSETPNVAGSYVLVFKSGVRLLYQPVK